MVVAFFVTVVLVAFFITAIALVAIAVPVGLVKLIASTMLVSSSWVELVIVSQSLQCWPFASVGPAGGGGRAASNFLSTFLIQSGTRYSAGTRILKKSAISHVPHYIHRSNSPPNSQYDIPVKFLQKYILHIYMHEFDFW